MSQMERPTSLKRPPRPAPDSDVDPIATDPEPQAATSITNDGSVALTTQATTNNTLPEPPASPTMLTTQSHRRGGREVTVPISTRVAPDVVELLDSAVAREGITFRAAVEQAVRQAWG